MKLIVVLILTLASYVSQAQDSLLYGFLPMKEGKVTYEKVITVDSALKNDLYNRGKSWALTYYNSQKDALQADDKDAGVLAYKGFFEESFEPPPLGKMKIPSVTWQYWETIKVLVKDGKAKIAVSNISIKQSGTLDTSIPIEDYGNLFSSAGKGKYKKFASDSKAATIDNFKLADKHILQIISQIEEYLTGKKKSDLDF
jgi:hypothetical protein